jgi:hypothetical protein
MFCKIRKPQIAFSLAKEAQNGILQNFTVTSEVQPTLKTTRKKLQSFAKLQKTFFINTN